MPPNLPTASRLAPGDTGRMKTNPFPCSPGDDFSSSRFPAFKNKNTRVKTFSEGPRWPLHKTQKPEEMAEAGLFFAGKLDYTRCFCCGTGLRNWMSGDIPAVEHARWEPTCSYIRWMKGDEFVDNVNENYPRIQVSSNTNRNASPSSSFTKESPRDLTLIITSVMAMPGCQALKHCGYSNDVVRNAIAKVLSENDWDETKVTTNQLAIEALNLSPGEPRKEVTEGSRPKVQDDDSDYDVPSPTTSIESLPDTDAEEEKLAAENLQMKISMRCKICLDNKVSVLFLPCGHIVTCSDCSSTQRTCPLCRSNITAVVNVKF